MYVDLGLNPFATWCFCGLVGSDVKYRCFQLRHRLVVKGKWPAACESTGKFLSILTLSSKNLFFFPLQGPAV